MNPKINSLNGLKGYMIWIIVLFHTYSATNPISSFISVYGGGIGNQFFFAISGFLTCYSFTNNHKIQDGFQKWFTHKLLRIWPAYAFFNLVALITIGICYISISDILLVFSMQTGGALTDLYPFDFPGWFLCTLIVCFCVFYFSNYISEKTIFHKKYIYIVLIFIGFILQIKNYDFPFLYFHNGSALVPFFVGCLLCDEYETLLKKKLLIYLGGVIFLALCFYTEIGDINIVLNTIFIPATILLCIDNKIINFIFNNPISLFLSKISLFVYLIHTLDIVVNCMKISYSFYLAVVFVCSIAFYYLDYFIRKSIRKSFAKPHEM